MFFYSVAELVFVVIFVRNEAYDGQEALNRLEPCIGPKLNNSIATLGNYHRLHWAFVRSRTPYEAFVYFKLIITCYWLLKYADGEFRVDWSLYRAKKVFKNNLDDLWHMVLKL